MGVHVVYGNHNHNRNCSIYNHAHTTHDVEHITMEALNGVIAFHLLFVLFGYIGPFAKPCFSYFSCIYTDIQLCCFVLVVTIQNSVIYAYHSVNFVCLSV